MIAPPSGSRSSVTNDDRRDIGTDLAGEYIGRMMHRRKSMP
jgi:hypothetical protein